MAGVAEAVATRIAAAPELPEELNDPTAYDSPWLWWGLLGLLAVAAYYVVVLWATRERVERAPRPKPVKAEAARAQAIERIDHVEAAVRAGKVSPRTAHQRLSAVLRTYATQVSDVPASRMTLRQLRARKAPAPLVHAIEVMYPPEFAPDDVGGAADRLDEAIRLAREVVSTWS